MFTAAQGQAANELLAVIEIAGDKGFKKRLAASVEATEAHNKAREEARTAREALSTDKAAMAAERGAMDARDAGMDARDSKIGADRVKFDEDRADLDRQITSRAAERKKTEAMMAREREKLADAWKPLKDKKAELGLAQTAAEDARKESLAAIARAKMAEAEHKSAVEKLRNVLG